MASGGSRARKSGSVLVIVAAAVAAVAVGVSRADDAPFGSRFFFGGGTSAFSNSPLAAYDAPVFANSYNSASSLDPANTALALAKDGMNRYLLPSLGENAPEWAKRIEFETDFQKDLKPTYSVLTVQPIYQDADKQNTLFVQASQLRYDQIGKYRDTTNIGLGYRRLFLDNQAMAGLNAFFDNEWTYGHKRYSVGGELKWAMLDFNSNVYRRITDFKMIDASTSTEERAMNGFDLELRSQVPYLPWMRVGARYYRWQTDLSDDTKGWQYSVDADITQNLSVEAGWRKDNFSSTDGFVKFVFRLARTDRPVMLSDRAVSNVAFEKRDMRNYTLDKVRRENRIIVERKGGGIIVARGN